MDREAHAVAANHASHPKEFTPPASRQAGVNAAIEREDVTRLPAHPRRHAGAARGDPAARTGSNVPQNAAPPPAGLVSPSSEVL